jgi:hypothetical protein
VSSTPLCLLLLPSALEHFPRADEVHDLLRAPSVVAVEPARLARAPEVLAGIQAHRLLRKLDGVPRVVVLYDAEREALARQVAARCPGCELVDAPPASEGPAFKRNAPLWDRLEELGVARR